MGERVVKRVDEKVVERVGLLQWQIREANCQQIIPVAKTRSMICSFGINL